MFSMFMFLFFMLMICCYSKFNYDFLLMVSFNFKVWNWKNVENFKLECWLFYYRNWISKFWLLKLFQNFWEKLIITVLLFSEQDFKAEIFKQRKKSFTIFYMGLVNLAIYQQYLFFSNTTRKYVFVYRWFAIYSMFISHLFYGFPL